MYHVNVVTSIWILRTVYTLACEVNLQTEHDTSTVLLVHVVDTILHSFLPVAQPVFYTAILVSLNHYTPESTTVNQ